MSSIINGDAPRIRRAHTLKHVHSVDTTAMTTHSATRPLPPGVNGGFLLSISTEANKIKQLEIQRHATFFLIAWTFVNQ